MGNRELRALAFLRGEVDDFPATKAGLLPWYWDRTPADAMSADFPGYRERDVTLAAWINLAHRHRWAWDGLRSLYRHLRATGEPIPPLLHDWFDRSVFVGNNEPPDKGRGRTENADRDMRITAVFRTLRRAGVTRSGAYTEIGKASNLSPEAVRSVVAKWEHARPFP